MMEEKHSKLKTTILTLLRLSEDETTIGTTALRLTGTNATEGKKPHSINRKTRNIYAGETEN